MAGQQSRQVFDTLMMLLSPQMAVSTSLIITTIAFVAWGLMDEPIMVDRIPDAQPEDLLAGFRLLTGVEPLVTPR